MSDPLWLIEEEAKRWRDAEALARRFHATYARQGPRFGCTLGPILEPWDALVAVCHDILTWTAIEVPQGETPGDGRKEA